VPFARILGEAFDETGLKDPKERGFGEHSEVFDRLKGGFVLFLYKDFDSVVALEKEGHCLGARGPDEAAMGDPAEFYGLDQVGGDSNYLVYSFEGSTVAYNLAVDPIAKLEAVGEGGWVPRDVGNDLFCAIYFVEVHFEHQEALPFPILPVPKVLNFNVAHLGDGSPLVTHSQVPC